MAKRTYQILVFILIVAVAVFAYELFYRSGDEQVPGGFERLAYVRNQNNMGGTLSYYAYAVSDTAHADYEGLASRLPHNKHYAVTTVFFFDRQGPVPAQLAVAPPHFDTLQFRPVATYVIHPSGNGELTKHLPPANQ